MSGRTIRLGLAFLLAECGLLGAAQAGCRVRPGARAQSAEPEFTRFQLQAQPSRVQGVEPCDLGLYTGLAFEGGRLVPVWADNSATLAGNPNLPSRVLEIATNVTTVGANAVVPSGVGNVTKRLGPQWNPAVAIDPTNPQHLAMVSQTMDGLVLHNSNNGGGTWNSGVLLVTVAVERTTPSIAFDAFGNCFVAFVSTQVLGEDYTVQVLTGDGVTFTPHSFQTNTFRTGLQIQPVLATGPVVDGVASTWLMWRSGVGAMSVTRITSTAFGEVSGPDVAVPLDNGFQSEGSFGELAVGPHGEVVAVFEDDRSAAGPSQIFAQRNPDGGDAHWSEPFAVTGTNVGFSDLIYAQPFCGIDAEPGLAWDRTSGRLYLVYVDENNNESDNTEIMLRYSDDAAVTWSEPLRVNDDATNRSQFHPRIAVDQSTGDVAITWLDCRDHASNAEVRVYGALIRAQTTLTIGAPNTPTEGAAAVLPVQLGQAMAAPVAVNYATIAGGTAEAGADYAATNSTLTFTPGTTTLPLTLPTLPDRLIEFDETMVVELSQVTGPATLPVPAQATFTLKDDRASTRPTGLTITEDASGNRLSWTDNCDNEIFFVIQRRPGLEGPITNLLAAANATSFVDTSRDPNIVYSYTVRAHAASGQESDSSEILETISGAKVTITPKKLNFGAVRVGSTKKLKVTIKNVSKVAVTGNVRGNLPAAYQFVGGEGDFSLLPRQKRVVEVSFTPQSAGSVPTTFTITTRTVKNQETLLSVTGKGR